MDQGSTERQAREPTGPSGSEIWKNCWSWSGPRFLFIFGPGPARDQPILVRDSLSRSPGGPGLFDSSVGNHMVYFRRDDHN